MRRRARRHAELDGVGGAVVSVRVGHDKGILRFYTCLHIKRQKTKASEPDKGAKETVLITLEG